MSAREKEIRQEIERLQNELYELSPLDRMGVREFARSARISPTIASRIKRGEIAKINMQTATKVLPFLSKCPLCHRALSPTEGE